MYVIKEHAVVRMTMFAASAALLFIAFAIMKELIAEGDPNNINIVTVSM